MLNNFWTWIFIPAMYFHDNVSYFLINFQDHWSYLAKYMDQLLKTGLSFVRHKQYPIYLLPCSEDWKSLGNCFFFNESIRDCIQRHPYLHKTYLPYNTKHAQYLSYYIRDKWSRKVAELSLFSVTVIRGNTKFRSKEKSGSITRRRNNLKNTGFSS